MSRRRRGATNRFEDGSRQSIGDYYVTQACNNINAACLKEAAMFTEGLDARDVVPMLFHDTDVAKLTQVHGLLATEDDNESYDLAPYLNGHVHIKTDWMPAPRESALYWQADRVERLTTAVRILNELHIKWGAVKHLLRWFNKNATPGAVRANWPSVLQLCPDAPMLKELQHSPTRYTNPQELPALLPLIRSTATTVASMAMLPGEAHPRTKGSVTIILPERKVDYEGITISLDSQMFFL
jgi:hypothetical protein